MGRKRTKTITAQWEVDQVELPDGDLTRDTYVLAPSYLFGKLFDVTAAEEVDTVDADHPRRKKVTATVPYAVYGIMLRVQQGSEVTGAEPPWAMVDMSAVYDDTGEPLANGEVPPLFP